MSTESTSASAASAVYHCPFCAGEDLRPSEAEPTAWVCRECARVFSVRFIELESDLIPGRRAGGDG